MSSLVRRAVDEFLRGRSPKGSKWSHHPRQGMMTPRSHIGGTRYASWRKRIAFSFSPASPSLPNRFCPQYLRYFRTLAAVSVLIVKCRCIKSGRSVRAPATEREKTPRCQPPESGGMRPEGAKTHLQPFPKMQFIWRLSLIHGESEWPILKSQTTAQFLSSRH